MRRPPPLPPLPDQQRRPAGPFGWLDARLLRDRWLEAIGADATAVLALLALAADRRGASFYSRDRMAVLLAIDLHRIDQALARLLELRLVVHRPWRTGSKDGVWQLVPVPPLRSSRAVGGLVSLDQLMAGDHLGPR